MTFSKKYGIIARKFIGNANYDQTRRKLGKQKVRTKRLIMLFKNKRKAIVAFRTLQEFADFCFEAEKLLSDENTFQDKKIQLLKKFSSFFVIDSILPSIRNSEMIFKEVIEGKVITKNFKDPQMLFADLQNFTEGYNTLLGFLRKSVYSEIAYFQSVSSICQKVEATENDYFNDEQAERLNKLCEAFLAYIPDFYHSMSMVTNLLGQIILEDQDS